MVSSMTVFQTARRPLFRSSPAMSKKVNLERKVSSVLFKFFLTLLDALKDFFIHRNSVKTFVVRKFRTTKLHFCCLKKECHILRALCIGKNCLAFAEQTESDKIYFFE